MAAAVLAGMLVMMPASASATRTLHSFSGVQTRGAVVFHLRGLRHQPIRWGRLLWRGRSISVRAERLRRAAARGVLRMHLVSGRRGRRTAHLSAGVHPWLIVATAPRRTVARLVLPGRSVNPAVALPGIPASARYVSPSGDDANPGSAAAPWRTLAKATTAAAPGDTVVLEAGTYGARGTRTNWNAAGTAAAPINFIGDPSGTRPTILGYNVLYGAHVRVWNLLFDGPTGNVGPNPSGGEEVMLWLQAPDIQINDSEIRNAHWHAGIYVTGGNADKLIGNYIHDNGNRADPAQANLDHGIYWDSGNGGVIANNLIVHNLAHGIQLYPDAQGVNVEWNTIADNGKAGVMIAENAANNTVANNIVANNTENSIRSWSLTGTGNTAHDNIVWKNGTGNIGTEAEGLTLSHNTQTDPQFAGASAGAPAEMQRSLSPA